MFVSSFPAAICMCTTLEAAGLTIGLELWMMALCDGGGMNRLLFQAVFLAMGLTAGVRLFHDVTPSLVYGALVAVCCAALGEYAGCMPLTVMLLVVLDCGACLVWSWCLLLPIAAFNAALLQDGKPVMVVARWLWLMPILTMALRCGHADVRPLPATQVALLTTLGFACGLFCVRNAALAEQVKRLQDSKRSQIRRLRSQLAEHEEDRALAVRTATLAERTRIAREIHDNVGHVLTRAIMQSEAAQVVSRIAGQDESARQIAQIHDTLGEAMTMVRKSVHDLKDEGTDFVAQIEAAAHSMDDSGVLIVRLANDIASAPAAVSRCFATTIREALNNTVRHSSASNVTITLHDFPALWQLSVQDDGARHPSETALDTPPETVPAKDYSGIGLADIEERARALGGNALCGPYHDGWRVFVSIPKPLANDGANDADVKKGIR